MKTTTTTRDRVLGTLWGISLGDAFGMPMEMWPRDRRERQLGYVTTLLPGQPDNDISKGGPRRTDQRRGHAHPAGRHRL